MIKFEYGDIVVVRKPGEKVFTGYVYSQYRERWPGSERIICVQKPNGCGIGYRVRYVHHRKTKAPKKTLIWITKCLKLNTQRS